MKTPEAFMDYFRTNYPGPNTIISKPDWHAPKIYAAAIQASGYMELLYALKIMSEFWLYALNKPDGAEPTAEDHARAEQLGEMSVRVIAKAEGAQ